MAGAGNGNVGNGNGDDDGSFFSTMGGNNKHHIARVAAQGLREGGGGAAAGTDRRPASPFEYRARGPFLGRGGAHQAAVRRLLLRSGGCVLSAECLRGWWC